MRGGASRRQQGRRSHQVWPMQPLLPLFPTDEQSSQRASRDPGVGLPSCAAARAKSPCPFPQTLCSSACHGLWGREFQEKVLWNYALVSISSKEANFAPWKQRGHHANLSVLFVGLNGPADFVTRVSSKPEVGWDPGTPDRICTWDAQRLSSLTSSFRGAETFPTRSPTSFQPLGRLTLDCSPAP